MFKIDISQHINILKKYQNYKVEYDINQFNCSVSRIIRSIREKKHSELLKFWNQRSLIDTFELEHPYYNFIKTRAVKNFHKGIINCVLMIDENKKNPWIFMQIIDKAMNGFVTKEQFVWFAGNSVQERSCVDFLLQVLKKNEEIDNLNKSFSFLMNTDRPFPFFVTIANNFLFLKNKKLKNQKIFFDFEDAYENNNSVAIYPGTLHPEILDYNTMPIFNYVYQKSLLRKKFLINDAKKYQLKIWLGIPGERREWINWEYDIILLLLELLRYFQSIQIYLDGLTSLNGVKEFFLENENICNKLNEYFKINKLRCNFFSVAGCDYATKVSYCSNVDMAISDIGTTVLIPINFCQKRTVLFGLKKQFSIEFSTYYQKFIKDLNLKVNDFLYIKSNKEHSSWYFINSFYIPWQHIYNLTAEVLEELSAAGKLKIKDLKMHRLDVPPVELVARKYELEQKFKVKLSIENVVLFNELEKKIDALAFNTTTIINNINNTILSRKKQNIENLNYQIQFKTAKARIQNHLSYKLGQVLIENSKSIFGYIRMPFVLSYIKDKHKLEQKAYEEKIKENPNLALPPLETYPDYKEALKEKECLTYKLGQAFIKSSKTWYKGGYVKFIFEIRKLKKVSK